MNPIQNPPAAKPPFESGRILTKCEDVVTRKRNVALTKKERALRPARRRRKWPWPDIRDEYSKLGIVCSPTPTDALRDVANKRTTKEGTDLRDNNNPGTVLLGQPLEDRQERWVGIWLSVSMETSISKSRADLPSQV